MPVTLLLVLLAQVASPPADPRAKASAQTLLREGAALYERGDFAAALKKFEAAYTIYPSPKLQFNIAQTDRDLGRPVEALKAFQRFLAQAPDSAPDILSEARQSVTQLTARLGQITIDCPTSGASVAIDGNAVGTTPLGSPVWATPGNHQITIRQAPYMLAIVDLTVAAGEVRTVTPKLRLLYATNTGPPPAAPPAQMIQIASDVAGRDLGRIKWSRRRWFLWTAASATAVLGTGAIVAGLSADSRFNNLQDSCGKTTSGCSVSQINGVKDRATLTNVLWALTGASAVITGVFVYIGSRDTNVSVALRF